jgi:hypothetical protein
MTDYVLLIVPKAYTELGEKIFPVLRPLRLEQASKGPEITGACLFKLV